MRDPVLNTAELFNNYHSVFSTSTYNLPPENSIPTPDSVLSKITITDMDVYKLRLWYHLTPPNGHLIGPKILKCGAFSLYCLVHHLFTLCLSQHSILSGDKSLVKNYHYYRAY